MIILLTCDVCHVEVELGRPEVVAAAEVLTFAEAHSEHAAWSIRLTTAVPAERA